jgi:serine/threonine-protein kinase
LPGPSAERRSGWGKGRVIGDRYGLTGLIAEGGMGAVYEAEHLAMGKLVAIKVLHPRLAANLSAARRLRREARVAGTLGHPNICAIYDMGKLEDGSPYLVLERLHGETLAQRLAREQSLAAPEMLDILLQVLSALAAAHQRGITHRDLKPENIFLSKREGMRPVPKLLDFGISKAESESLSDTTTSEQMMPGTPYYMAPEQARGERRVDWRVDLWAVGVVLYEGLTGHRPFAAKNFNALLLEIQNVPHRPIRDHDPTLPIGLAKVVDKALAKVPEDRYQAAIDFQRALRNYKDLEGSAPKQVIPILINEQSTDEDDGTHVFSRILPIGGRGIMLGTAQGVGAGAPAGEKEQAEGDDAGADDAKTPIFTSDPAPIDEERTVIDERSYDNETVTTVRPDPRSPGAKR